MKESLTKRTLPIFCAALMVGAAGCSPAATEAAVIEENPAISVRTQLPTYASLEQRATFAGKISPDETVAVLGKIGGTVQQTNFEVGDTVRKGQVLYVIDPSDIQLAVDQAKIAYETALKNVEIAESGSGDSLRELQYKTAIDTAQQAYERARDNLDLASDDDFDMSEFRKVRKRWKDATKAYDKNQNDDTWKELLDAEDDYYELLDDYTDYQSYVTSFESAYTSYENALEQYDIYKKQQTGENKETYELSRQAAENAYQQALQKLSYTQVTAPIDGIIEEKYVDTHATFGTSSPAYVISNKSIVNVEFSVSADIARSMAIGDAVEVESGSTVYHAEIVEIGNAASSSSGLFTVKARLEDGSDLFTGVSVKLTAITAKAVDAMTIPLSTVYYESGDAYVYVAKEGAAVKTPVTLGVSDNEQAEVLQGLSPEDELITTWNPNLNDGVAIEILETEASVSSEAGAAESSEADAASGQEG
ncbi:efflux RND transporter periplasmic adaptor subunit [Yanshouia hominis]|uniref:Efflux RND transporter periplasmic adaptor subunit n=1 Tax=Yanshouia hominis TaxID=2763673 RepID=A0ABR7NLT4_9FIRM|nr:efflux RND transporter periplasmic adaptor subunit [Yanshouia hominis]MBC8577372.1 efflux RND transporter periplasmic adaptor subunit [Yanshouia hominis]